jgi:hypothetical protein
MVCGMLMDFSKFPRDIGLEGQICLLLIIDQGGEAEFAMDETILR